MAGNLTIIDRVAGFFSAREGARRQMYRNAMDASAGGYRGGKKDRRATKLMNVEGGAADADLLPNLKELRNRSRDLVRNVPISAAPINRTVTNVVGSGLRVRPDVDFRALGIAELEAEEWNQKAAALFRCWSEDKWCDATRSQTFAEMQDIVLRGLLESGDTFTLFTRQTRPGDPFDLRLMVYEADQVDNPARAADGHLLRNGNRVYAGVEVDPRGAAAAYWLASRHPGSISAAGAITWRRVRAYGAQSGRPNILHHFRKLRPGQHRGVPFLAPAIELIKKLGDYTDAEVMAAVITSCFAIVSKTEGGDGLAQPNQADNTTAAEREEMHISEGGQIVDMYPGDSIEGFDTNRPNANFDGFAQAILRQIGAMLEIPFEVLLGHFTRSYSAARAALLEAWRFFRRFRAFLVTSLCRPVYEALIEEAVIKGRLVAPGFLEDVFIRKAWLEAAWIGDAQGQLDPVRETKAAVERIAAGLSTIERETLELNGSDWHRNHEQRRREYQARLEAGLEARIGAPAVAELVDDDLNNDDGDAETGRSNK